MKRLILQQRSAAKVLLLTFIVAALSLAQTANAAPAKPHVAEGEAVKALIAKAEGGDAQAQYELAQRYSQGQGMPMNRDQAFRWYSAAAAKQLAKAEYALAKYYNGQIGNTLDLPQALALTIQAAEHGEVPAQAELGFVYFNGNGATPKNLPRSFHWFEKAAKNGSVVAQCMIGDFYKRGWGNVKQDYGMALKWYKLSAAKEDKCASKSQFELYDMYAYGKGVSKNWEVATAWLKRAAEAGNPTAQQTLGRAYQMGYGVRQDPSLAKRWMKKSREGVAPHDDHEHDDDGHGH